MITSLSTNEEIMEAMKSEKTKVVYWLRKRYPDNRETFRLCERMKSDHRRTGQTQCSEPIEYTAPSENRWLAFLKTTNTGGHYDVNTVAFIYRETVASVEAIVPMGEDAGRWFNGVDRVMVYTPHFFQRMAERIGISQVDRATVMRLLSAIEDVVLNPKGDSKKRHDEVEVSVMGTVWRGIFRNGDKRIVEMKTILPKTSLTQKERGKLKKLDKAQQNAVLHYKDSDLERIANGDPSLLGEMYDNAFVLGVDDSLSSVFQDMAVLVKLTADRLNVTYTFDEFMLYLLQNMKGERDYWDLMIETAYDTTDIRKVLDNTMAMVVCTLKNFGCKFPEMDIARFFEPSGLEYYGDQGATLKRLKPFFRISNKSLFQPQIRMDKLTGKNWSECS